jgi:phosphoglycerate kinase
MSKMTLEDLAAERLSGARVVVRADLNVPLADGSVGDDTRIRATLPTLNTLLDAGASVVLLSHLGRPGGRPDPAASLRPVSERLAELLGRPVAFSPHLLGEEAEAAVRGLEPGQVLLLENTRFHPGETKGDEELARALARHGEIFVNDAFGTAHRDHASTSGIARAVREAGGMAVAGHLVRRELEFLGKALEEPERPFVAVLGGAKISGKIDVIEALLPRVDRLLVGGAMANTFFAALGLEIGESLVEADRVELAREILEDAGERLLLPVDCVVAPSIEDGVETRTVERSKVAPGDRIGDVGPATRGMFAEELAQARTVLWNGPMGVFELDPFRGGTLAVARAVADATDAGAVTVVGGGDSASAAEVAGVTRRLSHVSTGGGASLELLAGSELPGVAALSDRSSGSPS